MRRVALLRGINVGGHGRLKMDALRAAAATAGLLDPSTSGASGNVLYTSAGPAYDDARALAEALADHVRDAVIIVRDAAHLESLVATDPFARTDPSVPDKWRFIGFLQTAAAAHPPAIPEGVPLTYAGRDNLHVSWTMAQPHMRAIDHPRRIEKALGVAMTVRNWNVVRGLAARLAP